MAQINDYKTLSKMFVELVDTQNDLKVLKGLKEAHTEAHKIRVNMSFEDIEHEPVELSNASTINYYIDFLEKRERALREQIDRKLNRRWFQFWKYI